MQLQKTDKKLAVLVDPDKWSCLEDMEELVTGLKSSSVDIVLVGGSLITNDLFDKTVRLLQQELETPVIIFPGNGLQISAHADGILLLSLISGRNPDFLIGQHVLAAPTLARAGIEIIPTGYLLVDGGNVTSASYLSNTRPIPNTKSDIAACTALAGEQLGMKAIYLDGGSGANQSVPADMIRSVSETVNLPLIVGGGIRSLSEAQEKWDAGANLVVIGTAIESNLTLLNAFAPAKESL